MNYYDLKDKDELVLNGKQLREWKSKIEFGFRNGIINIINKELIKLDNKLDDENLPELTQANLSGMILSLVELKNEIRRNYE